MKNIHVQRPQNLRSMYCYYKTFFSIVLEAAADALYKLITVDGGGFGRQVVVPRSVPHNCTVDKEIKSSWAFLPDVQMSKLRVCLWGGDANSLLTFFLTPCAGSNVTIEDQNSSRCRKPVECDFDILYSKWRQLCVKTKIDLTDPRCIMRILHNTTIDIDNEGIQRHLSAFSAQQQNDGMDVLSGKTNEAQSGDCLGSL